MSLIRIISRFCITRQYQCILVNYSAVKYHREVLFPSQLPSGRVRALPFFLYTCAVYQLEVNIAIMYTSTQQAIQAIKDRAKSAGFRLSDVGRVANIDPAQLSRWTTGKTVPLYSSIIKLNEAVDALISARMTQLAKDMDEAVK